MTTRDAHLDAAPPAGSAGSGPKADPAACVAARGRRRRLRASPARGGAPGRRMAPGTGPRMRTNLGPRTTAAPWILILKPPGRRGMAGTAGSRRRSGGKAGTAGSGGGRSRRGASGAGVPEPDLAVLRARLSDGDAREMFERKKTDAFRTMLIRRPKREDVRVESVELYYEGILAASARYKADYYRKATHELRVERGVREIVIAGTVFAARESDGLSRIARRGRGSVDVDLDEHVYVDNSGSFYLDAAGSEVDAPFKGDLARSSEPRPGDVLDGASGRVRGLEKGAAAAAVDLLRGRLQEKVEGDARDLTDEFSVEVLAEVYVPVYEARLVGPRRRMAIMRIDAVRKSVL